MLGHIDVEREGRYSALLLAICDTLKGNGGDKDSSGKRKEN